LTQPNDTGGGPFGRAALIYRSAGWEGTLPLGVAPGKKYPPPGGWTGHGAPYPSGADVGAWIDTHGHRNIGIRMPAGVIGLDIDAGYGDKRGDVTLAELEARFGPLPPTWVSSARPAPSGIRFYRVPVELDGRPINWPGEAGKFIEIIQPGHRYAVVWPSTNPDAGGARYEWRHPGGLGEQMPPTPGELPHLPEAWLRGLALPYDRTEKADLGNAGLAAWWERLRPGDPCPVIHNVCTKAVDELRRPDSGARHETARDALRAIVGAGGAGHRGAREAVQGLALAFAEAVGAERGRSGEWERMLAGAVRLAATVNPVPAQMCNHDIPAAVSVAAPEGFTRPGTVSAGGGLAAAPNPAPVPGALTLPDEFWNSRDVLRRIRQAAHHKVRSGDVVFYGVLARLAAMAPHRLRADTGVGTPASLNLFAAIIGPSGSGKSSGVSVSRLIVKTPNDLDEVPLGSGEGIAEAYMGEALEGTGVMAKDGSEKQAKVRKQVRHNVLFHSDEGAGLNKLIERAGSTVGETLRTAWTGETIGQKNGRAETTRTVPAGSYSAGLVIGYQESTVLPMLDDHEAGTPQRFLYAWAIDASIPPVDAPAPWPGEMLSPFPADVPTDLPAPGGALVATAPLPARGVHDPITFAEAIRRELYVSEHAKATGTLPTDHPLRDPMRSQHNVLKVKVAALLALLDGRRNVTEEDWRLAQMVLDTSDAVRAYLQALAAEKARAAREAAIAVEAELEHHRAHARAVVAEVLDTTAETRVGVLIATWVHETGAMTLGEIRKRLASRDRSRAEAGVMSAMGAGWLVADGKRFAPGLSRPAG
jgi:hypothetical protein